MNESPPSNQIVRRVRRLSIAVWVLAFINLSLLSAWLAPSIISKFFAEHVLSSTIPGETLESWDGMTIEEKIRRSSVIVIVEYKADREKLRAIVKEIRKPNPDVKFSYGVGDEYGPVSVTPKPDTQYGDGAVVLLYGSPAKMHESYSVYGSTILGLDEMPLSKFIELAEKRE